MVTFIPSRFRAPITFVVGLVGILVALSSYTRWQNGPFYGWHFNAVRAMAGLAVLGVAAYLYRHQDD